MINLYFSEQDWNMNEATSIYGMFASALAFNQVCYDSGMLAVLDPSQGNDFTVLILLSLCSI